MHCIGESEFFYFSAIFSMFLALASFVLNGILIFLIPKNSTLSKNIVILVNFFAISFMSYNFFDFLRNIFVFYQFLKDPSNFFNVSAPICWIINCCIYVSGLCQSVLIVAIAIERVYAILRYRYFNEGSIGFSVVLLILLAFANVAMLFGMPDCRNFE